LILVNCAELPFIWRSRRTTLSAEPPFVQNPKLITRPNYSDGCSEPIHRFSAIHWMSAFQELGCAGGYCQGATCRLFGNWKLYIA